ncbi:MAG: hypothetical protein LBH54_04080, partial [Clostridiales bacterium]|nr:hypothetical protein [Clostridiales bacterium]
TVTDADDPANTWSGDFSGTDVYNLRTGAKYPAAFYSKGDNAVRLANMKLNYTGTPPEVYDFDDDFSGYTAENAAIGLENAVIATAVEREKIAGGTTADGVTYQWNTSVVYGAGYGDKLPGKAWIGGGLNVHDYWAWVTTANLDLKNYALTSLDKAQFTVVWGFNPTGVRLAVSDDERSYLEFGYSGAENNRGPEGVPLYSAYALIVIDGTAVETQYCPVTWSTGGIRYFDWTVVFDGQDVDFTVADASEPAHTWSGNLFGANVYNLRTGVKYPAAFYAKGDDYATLANIKLNYSGDPLLYAVDGDDLTLYVNPADYDAAESEILVAVAYYGINGQMISADVRQVDANLTTTQTLAGFVIPPDGNASGKVIIWDGGTLRPLADFVFIF